MREFMNDIVVLDIETVQDNNCPQQLLNSLYDSIEVTSDGRLTDPQKIEDDYARKFAKAKQTMDSKMALSPMTGKICCFGYLPQDMDTPICTTDTDEKVVLRKIQEVFNDLTQLSRIVTFNGKSFDLPFIKVRCAVNNIALNLPFSDNKYSLEQHFDVRSFLTNFEQFGKGTLDQWAMFFSIPTNGSGHSGSMIQEWYNKGEMDKIAAKCKGDVMLTASIYNRIEGYYR